MPHALAASILSMLQLNVVYVMPRLRYHQTLASNGVEVGSLPARISVSISVVTLADHHAVQYL
jgi:hypothetical protein